MPRMKIKHDKNYTVVQNDFIYDKELNTFDKGLLLTMLSKKDDYVFSVDRIAKEIGETRQKVIKSLKAIEKAGYLSRAQTKSENRFREMIYYVADIPCFKETEENSITEDSNSDNCNTECCSTEISTTENCITEIDTDLLNTNLSNTNISSTKESNTMPKKSKKSKKPEKDKIQVAEDVSMTEKELSKLTDEFGKPFTDRCIEILNKYKLSSGRKYKSDYYAVRSWVVEKVKRENPKLLYAKQTTEPPKQQIFDDSINPFADIE